MEQEVFSDIVKNYLSERYPQFLDSIKYKADGSFDCSLKNPAKEFSVWIDTSNEEITIGLEDPASISGCHTHFTPYEDDTVEVLSDLSKLLEEIFTNKCVFYHSNISGFSWSSDIVKTLIEKKAEEAIEFFTWDGPVSI
ncbi:hypothetical protein [Flavisolibacter tropicus]|uniref:Uncharacterized protein n=1 Tax=Flavisolibacter tropicus TaxID=1492898 RepID=A0A172TYN2_9BACT|nr:hypothetical protein [Flavisolibacter tropicus]ANE52199.1 hypothetical protein SY85_18595 [Flavisolibacter tropicus]